MQSKTSQTRRRESASTAELSFLHTHTSASYLEIKYIIVLSLAPAVHLGKFPPPPDGEIKMKYPDHTLYSKHICLKAAAESGTFL